MTCTCAVHRAERKPWAGEAAELLNSDLRQDVWIHEDADRESGSPSNRAENDVKPEVSQPARPEVLHNFEPCSSAAPKLLMLINYRLLAAPPTPHAVVRLFITALKVWLCSTVALNAISFHSSTGRVIVSLV